MLDDENVPAGTTEANDEPPRSLDQMVGQSPTLSPELTERRAGIQRDKMSSQDRLLDQASRRLEEDRARAAKAYEQTGVEAENLRPWDADKAKEKYRTDPLESFGSLGSVFAVIASAFTHAPMENALNGAAAAMNAIKDGNDKDYERGFEAFKTNADLAMKRHTMMNQQYQNAISLMNTDMAASRAQLTMNAAKYDDKQLLTLMEAGMDKEALELIHKRDQIAKEQFELSNATTKATFQDTAMKSFIKQNEAIPDPIKRASQNLAAFNRIYAVKQTPQQEIMGQWFFENPNGTAEEAAKFFHDNVSTVGRVPALEAEVQRRKAELMKPVEEGGQGLSETEADTKARMDMKTASSASTVNPKNAEIKRRATEYMKPEAEGGLGMSQTEAYDRATKEVNETGTTLTANKRVDLTTRVNQYGHSLDKIDAVTGVLDKYTASAGITGKARRLAERLSNLAGSKDTNLVQMMRDIQYLKVEGPRLLLNSNGRPLSTEAGHINDIIGGLSAGDTVANTLRSMRELKKLYIQMRAETQAQLGSKRVESPEGGVDSAPPPPKSQPWLDAPVVPQ